MLETVRECVQDVFDVPGLVELMRDIALAAGHRRRRRELEPSPFAKSLLFGYVAQFLYEGDSPLAERRAAALALDPSLLAELLGTSEAGPARPARRRAVARTEAELQRLTPERAARDAEDVADLLRALGPLSVDGILARCREGTDRRRRRGVAGRARRRPPGHRGAGRRRGPLGRHRGRRPAARRPRRLPAPGVPAGLPRAGRRPARRPRRALRPHPRARSTPPRWPAPRPRVGRRHAALRRLVGSGRVVEGELLPTGGGGTEFCDAEVLRLLRRRSLAALRDEVEPVAPASSRRFLPDWQGVGGRLRGRDGLLRAVEQLSGAVLPASALETLVLPARVADYPPGLLDELMATRRGGLVRARVAARRRRLGLPAPRRRRPPHAARRPTRPECPDDEHAVLDALDGGGAFFFRALADPRRLHRRRGAHDDALGPRVVGPRHQRHVRPAARPARRRPHGPPAHRLRPPAHAVCRPPRSARPPRRRSVAGARCRPGRARRGSGRWSLLPPVEPTRPCAPTPPPSCCSTATACSLAGAVATEDVPGGFAAVYRVLAAAEEAGRVRRGYFVEGLGASQFATTGAVDRLRGGAGPARPATAPRGTAAVVLAASDPANPYGAALGWPDRAVEPAAGETERSPPPAARHQPGRKAGALVVLVDGDLVLYVERGGKTLLSWSDDTELLRAAAAALAVPCARGASAA